MKEGTLCVKRGAIAWHAMARITMLYACAASQHCRELPTHEIKAEYVLVEKVDNDMRWRGLSCTTRPRPRNIVGSSCHEIQTCLFASKEGTDNDEVPFDGSRRRDSYGVRGALSIEVETTERLGERRQASVPNYVMKLIMERSSGQKGRCCWYFWTTGHGEPQRLHGKGSMKERLLALED